MTVIVPLSAFFRREISQGPARIKFQYTHYTSCHATGVKKGFIKGEALRLLRTNSSETKFEENQIFVSEAIQTFW